MPDTATGRIIADRVLKIAFAENQRKVDHLIEWADRKGLEDIASALRTTRADIESLATCASRRVHRV